MHGRGLEMDFRLFLWFVVFLDVVWPMSLELDVVTGSFVGYL